MESENEFYRHQNLDNKKIKSKNFKNEKMASYYFNAKVLLNHEEPELAINLLRYCSWYDSFNSYVLDNLYTALKKTNKLDEAEKTAEQNLNYNYSIGRCLELANIYFLNDRDEDALRLYFDCLSNVIEDPKLLFEIYKNVGNIYVKFKEYDFAEEYFYKAYQLNNSSDLLMVNIGVLEFQKKDLEKSRYCFRKAIEIKNNNDRAWVGLAMTHLEFGDTELAWGNLTKALDINPNNRTALVFMSRFYNKTEKNGQCRNYLLNYLARNNFDGDISMMLIQNLTYAGDYQNAYLESFKSYLWNPENVENKKIYLELKNYLMGEA